MTLNSEDVKYPKTYSFINIYLKFIDNLEKKITPKESFR